MFASLEIIGQYLPAHSVTPHLRDENLKIPIADGNATSSSDWL